MQKVVRKKDKDGIIARLFLRLRAGTSLQKARRFFESGAPFVFCRKFNGGAESPARPEFFRF